MTYQTPTITAEDTDLPVAAATWLVKTAKEFVSLDSTPELDGMGARFSGLHPAVHTAMAGPIGRVLGVQDAGFTAPTWTGAPQMKLDASVPTTTLAYDPGFSGSGTTATTTRNAFRPQPGKGPKLTL